MAVQQVAGAGSRRIDRRQRFLIDNEQALQQLRLVLKRVLIIVNGKGGTGKTTTAANIAAQMAGALVEGGSRKRILVIEFDPQANLGTDLGYKRRTGDDQGASILHATTGTGPLAVVRDVRPHLDAVCAGSHLQSVIQLLTSADDVKRMEYWLNFANALASIAHEYEFVIIDVPPGDLGLQQLGMAIGQWVLIPSVFDLASRDGLGMVANLFGDVAGFNDEVDVLGILMFNFDRKDLRAVADPDAPDGVRHVEVGQRKRTREKLEADLERAESDAVVLSTVISRSPVAAEVCRDRGIVAVELADLRQSPEWPAMRKELGATVGDSTIDLLARDYEDLVIEIFGRVRATEATQ